MSKVSSKLNLNRDFSVMSKEDTLISLRQSIPQLKENTTFIPGSKDNLYIKEKRQFWWENFNLDNENPRFLKKTQIQIEFFSQWRDIAGENGTLCAATGSGKSRVALMVMEYCFQKYCSGEVGEILLVVPTTKLKEVNWRNEFEKWDCLYLYPFIKRVTYKTLPKVKGRFQLVVFDEAHNLTELSTDFFQRSTVLRGIGLTATPPRDNEKKAILSQYLPIYRTYSLNDAIKDGLVKPYKAKVLLVPLDRQDKIYRKKDKMLSEAEYSAYLDSTIEYFKNMYYLGEGYNYKKLWEMFINKRMHFLYSTPSKLKAGQALMEFYQSDRVVIFSASTKIADSLSPYRYHSKCSDVHYTQFCNNEILHLSTCRAVNEGHNLGEVKRALIIQTNSNYKNLLQQMGRILRVSDSEGAGEIIILCQIGSQDEKWVSEVVSELNEDFIEIYHIDDYLKFLSDEKANIKN